MAGFILRGLIAALGLWAATEMLDGFIITSAWTLVGAGLLLGIVNAIVRPFALLLSLPALLLTLGFFLLVINAAMLGLVALMLPGFKIAGFWDRRRRRAHRQRRELDRFVVHWLAWPRRGHPTQAVNGDIPRFLANGDRPRGLRWRRRAGRSSGQRGRGEGWRNACPRLTLLLPQSRARFENFQTEIFGGRSSEAYGPLHLQKWLR